MYTVSIHTMTVPILWRPPPQQVSYNQDGRPTPWLVIFLVCCQALNFDPKTGRNVFYTSLVAIHEETANE
jgi:hypothetical protein